MNDHKDYYNILGVNKKASHDEIKKAFRRLSLETHPDKTGNNEDSTNKFKEISEAWEVLQDSTKRKQYDMGNMLNDTVGINPEDLFKELFGGGNPFGDGIFQGMGPNSDNVETHFFHMDGNGISGMPNMNFRQAMSKPTPIIKKIKIPIEYAYTGCNIPIEIERWIQHSSTKEKESETLYVKIPAGVDEGTRIRVSGEGEAGNNGGSAGDLYIYINMLDNGVFNREGEHLFLSAPLDFYTAVNGGSIEVPSPAPTVLTFLLSIKVTEDPLKCFLQNNAVNQPAVPPPITIKFFINYLMQ